MCPAFAQKAGSGMAASTAVSDQFAESGVNANEANSAGSSADNTSSTGSSADEADSADSAGSPGSETTGSSSDAPSADESKTDKSSTDGSSADESKAEEPAADGTDAVPGTSGTGASGDNSGAASGDNSADASGDNSGAASGDNSEDASGDNSADASGDNSAGASGDNSEAASGDNSADASIDEDATGETGEEPGAASEAATTEPGAASEAATTDPTAASDSATTDPASAAEAATTDPAAASDTATTAPDEPVIDQEMIIEQEMELQSVIPDDMTGLTEDELFSVYAEGVFGIDEEGGAGSNSDRRSDSRNSRALTKAGDKLKGVNKSIYNEIGAELTAIAAGNRADTVFGFTIENKDQVQLAFTAQELGLNSLFTTDEGGSQVVSSEARKAADTKIRALMNDISLNSIVSALLADFPFELYWYNKTVNTRLVYSLKLYPDTDEGGNRVYRLGFDGTYSINLPVSADYASSYDYSNPTQNYQVNTAIGKSVQTAVARAKQIVTKHRAESDYQKLCSYRNEICALTSYNSAAAGKIKDTTKYGNASQIIWVFDGNASTSVVCEGYAKAFKYLCDETDFSGQIDCILVTGTLGGSTPHMWNIVRMEDGNNYLVDVTNCDSGMLGAPDLLFLVGAAAGEKIVSGGRETGYTVYPQENDFLYEYDDATLGNFSASQTRLCTRSYALNSDMLSVTESSVFTGSAITPVRLYDCGVLLRQGTDYKITCTNNVNVGTATASITGAGRYKGALSCSFRITAKKVTPALSLSKTTYVYNGSARTPRVTVTVGGKTLTTADYTVTYSSGHKKVGTYKVTVTLKRNYSGSKSASFKINPKKTKIVSLKSSNKKIKVKWKKQSTQTSGYQIQFARNKKFTSSLKTKTVKGASKVSKTYSGFKKGKKYYVRIRTYKVVNKKKYYSAWSEAKTVKVK